MKNFLVGLSTVLFILLMLLILAPLAVLALPLVFLSGLAIETANLGKVMLSEDPEA